MICIWWLTFKFQQIHFQGSKSSTVHVRLSNLRKQSFIRASTLTHPLWCLSQLLYFNHVKPGPSPMWTCVGNNFSKIIDILKILLMNSCLVCLFVFLLRRKWALSRHWLVASWPSWDLDWFARAVFQSCALALVKSLFSGIDGVQLLWFWLARLVHSTSHWLR